MCCGRHLLASGGVFSTKVVKFSTRPSFSLTRASAGIRFCSQVFSSQLAIVQKCARLSNTPGPLPSVICGSNECPLLWHGPLFPVWTSLHRFVVCMLLRLLSSRWCTRALALPSRFTEARKLNVPTIKSSLNISALLEKPLWNSDLCEKVQLYYWLWAAEFQENKQRKAQTQTGCRLRCISPADTGRSQAG